MGLLLGLVVVGVHWQMKRTAQHVPRIHDITTDTDDPPRFVDILPLRKYTPNSVDYGGPDLAAQQQAAYPDIQPVTFRMPSQQAFTQAVKAADAMGWDIVAADTKEGRIEATDTTLWLASKTILSFGFNLGATRAESMFGQCPGSAKVMWERMRNGFAPTYESSAEPCLHPPPPLEDRGGVQHETSATVGPGIYNPRDVNLEAARLDD